MKVVIDAEEAIRVLKNHVLEKVTADFEEPFITAKNEDGSVDVFSLSDVIGDSIVFEVKE